MNRIDPGDHQPEQAPDLPDRLDEDVVIIPCYEPAAFQLAMTGRTLCNHTVLLGATGSGKTGTIRWLVKSLIQNHNADPERKPGIFIFDLNGDDTVPLVKKWALEAGRLSDVRLLTPYHGYLDLFAHVRAFEDLPVASSLFMHGAWAKGGDNGYWHETTRTLLDAALSICLMVEGKLDTDATLRFVTNWLIGKHPAKEDERILQEFEIMCSHLSRRMDQHLVGKIEFVRATVSMWEKLDTRTKAILTSCIADAVGPLMALDTRKFLDRSRGSCFVPEELEQGRIMVFSLPAGRNPEAASLLGRIIKSRLYMALQDRPVDLHQRLCGIVADEFHYLTSGGRDRSSDVTALATLRARNVAVVAASQSLDHLAAVLGTHDFRSLIPNFGNHFFFRSTEPSTGGLASTVMGTREFTDESQDYQGSTYVGVPMGETAEWICPLGSLARLEPGQAYVAFSSGYRSNTPLWLAANREQAGRSDAPERPSSEASLQQLRKVAGLSKLGTDNQPSDHEKLPSPLPLQYDLLTWRWLVRRKRFRHSSYGTIHRFKSAVAATGHAPIGLESLPRCWWDGLISILIDGSLPDEVRIVGIVEREGCPAVARRLAPSRPGTVCDGWHACNGRFIPAGHGR